MMDLSRIAWPDNVAAATAIQHDLRGRVVIEDRFEPPRIIAGVDCSYDLERELSRAVIVLLDAATLEPFYSVQAFAPTTFPYVSGYLSFREIPVILEALRCLPRRSDMLPDLLMVDGQGIAHPRRLGIASHLGVLLDLPSIGVAKSLLCGKYSELRPQKGEASPLTDKGERIGTVLRSKDGCNPLFISPGHRIGHEAAVAVTRACLTRYRLPEPTRIADQMSKWRPGAAVRPASGQFQLAV